MILTDYFKPKKNHFILEDDINVNRRLWDSIGKSTYWRIDKDKIPRLLLAKRFRTQLRQHWRKSRLTTHASFWLSYSPYSCQQMHRLGWLQIIQLNTSLKTKVAWWRNRGKSRRFTRILKLARRLNNLCKATNPEAKNETITNHPRDLLEEKNTDYSLWKEIKYLKRPKTRAPQLRKEDCTWIRDSKENVE